MRSISNPWRIAAALLVGACAAPAGALAQGSYPDHPITLIVPFAPAGSVDYVAREIANKMSESFPQGVVVTNRPGASAVVGTRQLASSPPDGYTIGLVNIAHASNPAFGKLPYDTLKDFTPISLVTHVPSMLLVNNALPVKNVADLIAYAKGHPGELNFGSVGVGTSNHLPMEFFMNTTGTKLTHVPYSNGGSMNSELLSGQVKVAFITVPTGRNLLKTGKVRALAVASARRLQVLPDVPAIAETVPGFEFYDWHAVVAPAGLPQPVVARLNAAVNKTLSDPELKDHLQGQGAEIMGTRPEELASFMHSETAKWDRILKQAGVQPKN